jgi:hypothetical protein
MELLSNLFILIHYSVYKDNGIGVIGLKGVGDCTSFSFNNNNNNNKKQLQEEEEEEEEQQQQQKQHQHYQSFFF